MGTFNPDGTWTSEVPGSLPEPVDQPDPEFKVFTLASLAKGGEDREEVERFLGDYVDRLDDGYTYDDILDLLDMSPWETPEGWTRVYLPESTADPVYVRLLGIARRIRQETRS